MQTLQYKWPRITEWLGCGDEPWFVVFFTGIGITLPCVFCFVIIVLAITNAKQKIYGYAGMGFLLLLFFFCMFFVVREFKSMRDNVDPTIPMDDAHYHLLTEDQISKECKDCKSDKLDENQYAIVGEFFDTNPAEEISWK